MMKTVLSILAVGTAMIAAPAMAQTVTGTVNITGSVAPKCIVATDASNMFTVAGATVALGELADTDGRLKPTGTIATTFGSVSAKVVCTSAAPEVSVKADPIATAAPASTGYDNSIDYLASVKFTRVGGDTTVTNDSSTGVASTATLASRLANSGDNILVTASAFQTNAPTDLLVASPSYAGKITVVVGPGI
ncbi:hypothetical protein M9978_03840 [Sphingomonas sp. MG17]|uniref:Uncharacterized protein n=1 Tax=Sphingomonas tagetis TaxID=2949092 RepID=A0A9X2KKN3_9SPHN|nr:hypothetical protein [Sphingomonas tagetis]MCP3729551.1 hypothetical protein [Sphingomonas tagetis]